MTRGRGKSEIFRRSFDARHKPTSHIVDARERLQNKKNDARQKIGQSKPTDARQRIKGLTISQLQEKKLDARQLIKSRKTPNTSPIKGITNVAGATQVLVTNSGRSLMKKTGPTTSVSSGAKGQLIKTIQQQTWQNKKIGVEVVMTPKSEKINAGSVSLSYNEFEKQRVIQSNNKPLTITCLNNHQSNITGSQGQPAPVKRTGSMYADMKSDNGHLYNRTGNVRDKSLGYINIYIYFCKKSTDILHFCRRRKYGSSF